MKTNKPNATAITKSSAPASLLRVEEACALLAKCRTIDEAKGIRDKAEAIKAYLRTQNASLEAQNDAAEIKIRAERRLGELLSEQRLAGTRATKAANLKRGPKLQAATSEAPPTLKQLGIEKTAASRWTALAGVPEEQFEGYVKEQRATPQGEITSAGIRQEIKAKEKQTKRAVQVAQVRVYRPPADEYGICAFDYPWKFEDGREGSEKSRNGADYPRMTLEEICAFPLPVAENCLLACWIPNALLIDGTWEKIRLSLETRYGAKPKQMRTWRKTGEDGGEVTGLGKAFRNDTEHLILLERGTVTYVETGAKHEVPILRTAFDAPRGRGSEKPQVAYDQLAAICPMRPMIDVFAREGNERPGWVTTGAESPTYLLEWKSANDGTEDEIAHAATSSLPVVVYRVGAPSGKGPKVFHAKAGSAFLPGSWSSVGEARAAAENEERRRREFAADPTGKTPRGHKRRPKIQDGEAA